jgi:hypothetical protein
MFNRYAKVLTLPAVYYEAYVDDTDGEVYVTILFS